ncbi:DUF2339 domain-containing protein [Pseudonocardia halophobica]|nr:DUF2339 domain-containing protein [Pseudonocardia halophobica]
MSEPTGRPPALDERLLSVAVELTRLGRRVDELGGTVNALVTELRGGAADGIPDGAAVGASAGPAEASRPSADASAPSVPPRVSRHYTTDPVATLWTPRSGVSPSPAGGPWGPFPPGVAIGPHQAFQYAAPIGPRRPSLVERLRGRFSGPALLAVTGAAVTLLGVVLLLVLAASRGWFSPPGRVAAGALLGAVLVGLGMRLHRRPEARTGALALVGTGVTALYLTVAAATALYGLLPAVAGLLAALVVAAGGVALADRWRSQALALGSVVGAALLAPFVADGPGPLLVALVVVLQAAAVPAVVRRGWGVLAATAAGAPALTAWSARTPNRSSPRSRPRPPRWSWGSSRRSCSTVPAPGRRRSPWPGSSRPLRCRCWRSRPGPVRGRARGWRCSRRLPFSRWRSRPGAPPSGSPRWWPARSPSWWRPSWRSTAAPSTRSCSARASWSWSRLRCCAAGWGCSSVAASR